MLHVLVSGRGDGKPFVKTIVANYASDMAHVFTCVAGQMLVLLKLFIVWSRSFGGVWC